MEQDRLMAGKEWFSKLGWTPFPYQLDAWESYLNGASGMVNAPTGSGKTYSLLVPILLESIDTKKIKGAGPRAIWITPIRALGKEIELSAHRAIEGLGMRWKVGVRSGDTSARERARQKESPPDFLITTPESLHLLLAQKDYPHYFSQLKTVVVDEWHELLGSKRGVQVELALSRLKTIAPQLKVWGISATIGNMKESLDVLLGNDDRKKAKVIRADIQKLVDVISIFPDELERMPWSGHLGIRLLEKVVPIVKASNSTLIFTNTRSFAEIWYHKMLDMAPEFAGLMAMHHGSISQKIRNWVEEQLHAGKLKAVVCTSSLDLGVDFRPVETIIQVGSPKGVARFLQRAGRSGHQPGAVSTIYFLPTHSLELMEAAALKSAMKINFIESRVPMLLCYDVLIQYLNTLAISDGFLPDEVFKEVASTYCYKELTRDEWEQLLHFITIGGNALQQYDDFKKTEIEDGVYKMKSRRMAMRHRLHIGTIVSESMLKVKFIAGGYVGVIEEYFISRLDPGDVFTLAGRNLEFVMIKDMTALVRKSSSKKSKVPSWNGGRMPLSANLGKKLREMLH